MERRNFLGRVGAVAGGAALLASRVDGQTSPAKPADRNSLRTVDFGAMGNGRADDTASIQRAIDEAHKMGGGTVHLEGANGRNFACKGRLSLDNKQSVRIVGGSGPNGPATTQLLYTGRTGPFISLASSYAIWFEGVQIAYDDPQFSGPLVATGHSSAKADPAYLRFDQCIFIGRGRAQGAEPLLDLTLSIITTIDGCAFNGSKIGIKGTGKGYSNAIQILNSTFLSQSVVSIANAGEAWLISGCTFEPLSNGKAGAYKHGSDTGWSLTFIGCWMGDVSQPGGCWIDLSGGPVVGLTIIGNRMAPVGTGRTDTAIKIGNGTQGVSILGNRIEGPVGIDFVAPTTFGASITGNDLQCAVPIANLKNAVPHFVAGQYTTQNYLSGTSNLVTASFTGDGERGGIQLVPQAYGPPTKPKDGDMWTTPSGFFVRIGGVTRKVTLT